MITSQDKTLLSRLIKKYASNVPTEEMIAFVADNNGMLAVCKLLTRKNNEDDREAMGWVDKQCYSSQVDVRNFLYEINQILSIFQPGQESDEYYNVLGLEIGASEKEIKHAYKTLSLRYHPDTSIAGGSEDADTFIEITKAYHALLTGDKVAQEIASPVNSAGHWRGQPKNSVSRERKKKNILWFSALAVAMIVVSIVAANGYRKKAMLAGLQNSRVAFIPPHSIEQEEKTVVNQVEQETKAIAVVTEPIIVESKVRQKEIIRVEKDVHLNVPEPDVSVEKVLVEAASPRPVKTTDQDPLDKAITAKKTVTPVTESIVVEAKVQQKEIARVEKDVHLNVPEPDVGIEKVLVEETSSLSTKITEQDPPNKIFAAKKSVTPVADVKRKIQTKQNAPTVIVKESDHKEKQDSTQVSVAFQKQKEAEPSRKEIKANTQGRIDEFFTTYLKAYENKNFLAFSRFFDLKATENGKPLTEIMPTYIKLFEDADSISLAVMILKWKQKHEKINIDGRFTIHIRYKNSREVFGKGEISFLLADLKQKLLIKELHYQFDKL